MEAQHKYRVATVGMFDGVHLGHRHLINLLCDYAHTHELTPTVFTFDRHPLHTIAPERMPRTITTPAQRVEMIVDAGVHDVLILVFNQHLRQLSAADFLKLLHDGYGVRAMVVGFNHRFGHDSLSDFAQYKALGEKAGIEIIQATELPSPQHINSSVVRALLHDGNIEEANRMLGHRFTLRGKVVHGQMIGRTIGYPTVNVMPLAEHQLIPAVGVYAADVLLPDGTNRRAMVNIGTNPTVNDKPLTTPRIEAHILDFDGDLYGQPLEISFLSRLRDERKFATVDDLRQQLALDREAAIKA